MVKGARAQSVNNNQLENKIMDAYLKTLLSNIKSKSWKTTLVGCVLVISAIASVLLKITNWVDAIPLIVIALGFIFAEDSRADKK